MPCERSDSATSSDEILRYQVDPQWGATEITCPACGRIVEVLAPVDGPLLIVEAHEVPDDDPGFEPPTISIPGEGWRVL